MSTAGYALGYLGGGLLLALNVAWILSPATFGLRDAGQASRLSFLSVAVWWPLFSIPLFRRVPEPRSSALALPHVRTPRSWRRRFAAWSTRCAIFAATSTRFLLLIAFVDLQRRHQHHHPDGDELRHRDRPEQSALITAILLVQFVGIPFAFLFGMLAGRIGAKTSIFISLAVYTLITVMGYYMKTERDFYMLALMVAAVQGGSQALSRSLFASMIPARPIVGVLRILLDLRKVRRHCRAGVFGLTSRSTGSSRSAILSVMVFFVVGAAAAGARGREGRCASGCRI